MLSQKSIKPLSVDSRECDIFLLSNLILLDFLNHFFLGFNFLENVLLLILVLTVH